MLHHQAEKQLINLLTSSGKECEILYETKLEIRSFHLYLNRVTTDHLKVTMSYHEEVFKVFFPHWI